MSDCFIATRILYTTLRQHGPVGAAAGCDLLILIFGDAENAKDQKIAACGSSYRDLRVHQKR
ncbi:hypothetical protein E3W21_04865 [Pseudomonas sp. F01002]|nr:hypothetical protein E3W21_04865 [Pseudomonas sp. F01002]